jgi:IS5 family transposase
MFTPRKVADVTAAPEPLARMGRARYVLADKNYDADPLRRALRQARAVPVIPGRSGRKARSPLRPQML